MNRFLQNFKIYKGAILILALFLGEMVFSQTISVPTVTMTTNCPGSSVILEFTVTSGNGNPRQFTRSTSFTAYIRSETPNATYGPIATFTVETLPASGSNNQPYSCTKVINLPANLTPGSYRISIGSSSPTYNGSTGNNASATFTINPNNTVASASSNAVLCFGEALTNITHNTTGATGIGTPSGLPTGVNAVWSSNVITISGTPSVLGTFNYSIPLTGGCGNVNATGSISVNGTIFSGGTWSHGNPDSSKAAIFAENYSISQNLEACSITVNEGVEVSVASDKMVTLGGPINVQSGGKFILENNAVLLQNGNTNPNSDAIIVKRNSSAIKRLDYTLWSSPVAGQGVYAFSPTTLPNRFYTYNTTTDGYNSINFNLSNLQYPAPLVAPLGINGTDDSNIQFATAKGYLIRAPWNHPTAPAVFAGQFQGIPNNGDITYNMELSGEGYNLVGNPYPSKLSVIDFIDGNPNIEGTLYFWRKTNDANATTYATLTKLAYTANTAIGGDTGTGFFNSEDQANWVINVGQGFFVQADSANNQLYFNNGMRRGSNNQDQFFRTNGENTSNNDFVVEGVYWLNLSNETSSISQIAVGYSPNSTLGVDRGIDGKNINKDMYLASQIDGNDFAIQGRSSFVDTDVVPLSFKITSSGNYTISIGQLSGLFSDSQIIYLKDKVLNVTHSLTENGAYNFNSAAGTFTDRFEVVYTTAALGIDNPTFTSNHVIIYKGDSNQFVVNSGNVEMSSIKVFDIRGRLLTSQNNINATQTNVNVEAATQVLLMQITSTDGAIVTKKVIR
jgi:hypothetical protein